jgi:hypothetical protein
MQGKTEKCRKQAGSQSTDNAGDKKRRHEKKIERLGAESRRDQRTYNESDSDDCNRQEVAGRGSLRLKPSAKAALRGAFGRGQSQGNPLVLAAFAGSIHAIQVKTPNESIVCLPSGKPLRDII